MDKKLKVAIVHDWLTNFGGAERVIEAFCEIFPDAPIYTTVYNEENMAEYFPPEKVRTSFMQKIPLSTRYYTKMLSMMPRAFESFNLSGYDIVLSSSSSCAKGVITGPDTMHVSYIHTPMRYAWDLYHDYYNNSGLMTKLFMGITMPKIRQWDVLNTFRIDHLIANSNYVKRRIKKYYRREATVIYPPVGTNVFVPGDRKIEDYYLIVSRFVPYKRIDLAIKAFNELGKRLVVVGSGSEENYLKKIAKSNIEFIGRISDQKLKEYFQRCKALIFAAKEDFGIIPLEAQACGRPVIAFGEGGALETVKHLETGVHFKEQTVDSLIDAVNAFEKNHFDNSLIRNHAEEFSKKVFISELKQYIFSKYNDFI
ncbi:MAG: glycosyltransferase [bacterium]